MTNTKPATAKRKRCITGECRRLRRAGQRTCQQCHAEEMRERRNRNKNMKPVERLEKAMVHVAMSKRSKKALPPEFQEALNSLAASVAAQIEKFNDASAM